MMRAINADDPQETIEVSPALIFVDYPDTLAFVDEDTGAPLRHGHDGWVAFIGPQYTVRDDAELIHPEPDTDLARWRGALDDKLRRVHHLTLDYPLYELTLPAGGQYAGYVLTED